MFIHLSISLSHAWHHTLPIYLTSTYIAIKLLIVNNHDLKCNISRSMKFIVDSVLRYLSNMIKISRQGCLDVIVSQFDLVISPSNITLYTTRQLQGLGSALWNQKVLTKRFVTECLVVIGWCWSISQSQRSILLKAFCWQPFCISNDDPGLWTLLIHPLACPWGQALQGQTRGGLWVFLEIICCVIMGLDCTIMCEHVLGYTVHPKN